MNVYAFLRFRVILTLLVVMIISLTVSGCAAGWGDTKPTINQAAGQSQSQSQTVTAGQTAIFTAAATGTGPFTYQWYLNGVAIGGATSSSYTTPPTTGGENGSIYTVSVTNAAGTAMGGPYVLTVVTPPAITTQPQSQTVTAGQAAVFTVAAIGTAPLSYQWYLGGTAIPGATSASYTTPVTGIANNSSVYTVTVKNPLGSVTSVAATLTVNPEVAILSFMPVSSQIYGNPAFEVSASSASIGAITYSVVSGPATISGDMVRLTGTGTVMLSASQVAAGNYTAATATTSFTVAAETPTLAFASIPSQTYGNTAFQAVASSASTGTVTYSVSSGSATVSSGGLVTLTGTGTVMLSASQAATTDYTVAMATTSFTVAAETPTLAFTSIPSQTYGNAAFAVSASSASTGTVTYSVTSGPATISGDMVTLTGTGTVMLSASQAATTDYTAATATTSFTVAAETPTLAFTAIPSKTYGNAAFQAVASSASSGAITYSLSSGPATVSSAGLVTLTGTGTVVLSASQAATTDYTAATATTSFTVAAETPTLAFTAIPSKTYGNAAFQAVASSASSGAITYSLSSGPATVSSAGLVTLTGTGTVVLSASQAATTDYTAATATTSFTVAAETPTLAFASIPSKTYGNATFAVTASSASTGTVTYSVTSGPATISGATVTLTGTGTVVLSASQAATTDYTAATATTTFTVAAETPTLAFASVPSQTYGNAAFGVSASSASSGAITYSLASGPATISGATVTLTGTGTVVLSASQAATTDYTAATATTSFTVAAETPTLAFTSIPPQTYGNAAFQAVASSASSGAITYSLSSGPATVSSGGLVTLTGTGTVVLSASQAATTDYAAATTTTSFTAAAQVEIAISPVNETVAPGNQTFIADVTGGTTQAVTWTASGGTITSSGVWTSPNTAGTYTITATSVAEPGVHSSTTITVSLPVFTTQPVSQNLCGSGSLTLSVAANYATSYQWYFNGASIAGATSPTYTLAAVTSGNSGNYTVVATNPAGNTTSGAATVQVGSTIPTNPSNLTITEYQTAGFSVAASGKSPFSYQWYTIPSGSSTPSAVTGATSSTYITAVETATTPTGEPIGFYAVVTDACGTSLTSSTADLTVNSGNSPPTITIQPVGQTVPAGNTATFTATAVGSGTLSYEWYKIPGAGTNQEITGATPQTGTAISGATSASYTVPAGSTTTTNDQDVYYVEVTNGYGQAVSQHCTLAVANGIQVQITNEPVNAYVNAGAAASFTVTATSALPLTYQWYMVPPGQSAANNSFTIYDGSDTVTESTIASAVAIPGANGATYNVPAASSSQTGTVYYVVVGNGETSSVTSNAAALFVGTPASIPSCSANWNLLGTTAAFDSTTCSYQLTAADGNQYGEIVWPILISTANIHLSFTIATSDTSSTPADGFAMVLGDPSLGANLTSAGNTGEGLGARGIPGFVLAFDDFENDASADNTPPWPQDPAVPYLGVGRGETTLWENPYSNVNTTIPALANYGSTVSHSYVVSIVQGYMSVTMDGTQVFSGNVSVPPVAYLYVTSSTGSDWERTVISNISATVSAP